MTKDKIEEIALEILAYLATVEEGTELTTWEAADAVYGRIFIDGAYAIKGESIDELELMDIDYAIRKNDYHDFKYYLENLEIKEEIDGKVPDTTLFCLDEDRNIFVGAVNIRHYLNEAMLLNGGHIGDGIRPSERRKGYATRMIELALEECKKLGLDKVLMVCDKNNVGSAKSIINNGGVLENEVVVNGVTEQRYWIDLR